MLAIVLTLLCVLSHNSDDIGAQSVKMFMLEIAIYLALLNTTKELSGDFLNYCEDYLLANSFSLQSFLLFKDKEPVFYFFMWLFSSISDGNWPIFVFFFTLVNYWVVFEALLIIAKRINVLCSDLVVIIVFYAFFFQNFAMISNAVRQCISQSFALLFFAYLYFEKKRKWFLAIISVFIHSASIPILAVGMIPVINNRFSIKRLFVVVAVTLVSALFIFKISAFDSIPFIGYIFSRLDNEDQLTGADSWQVNEGISSQYLIMLFFLVCMILFNYRKMWRENENYDYGLLNISAILIIALLFWHFSGAFFLCMRYQFYLYTLQIVPILMAYQKINCLVKSYMRPLISISLPVYFYYYLGNGFYKYITCTDAMLWPVLRYICEWHL